MERAIRSDEELDRLFPGVIMSGGVLPHIHKTLIKKSSLPPPISSSFLAPNPFSFNMGESKIETGE